MQLILGLILLLSVGAFVIGVFIGLFAKGKRAKGWRAAGASIFVFALTATFVDPEAVAAGKTVPTVETTQHDDRPSEATLISEFCAFEAGIAELSAQKEQLYPDDFDAGQAWIEPRIVALRDEINARLGLETHELSIRADQGFWLKHCRAHEKGWVVAGPDYVLAVSRRDANAIRNALEARYKAAFEAGEFARSVSNRYTSARCKRISHDQIQFIGCHMLDASFGRSFTELYTVALSEEGQLMLIPRNGPALTSAQIFGTVIISDTGADIRLAELAAAPESLTEALNHF